MNFKRHHSPSSFHTDGQLADLEHLLSQITQQDGVIGVLVSDNDGNLIVSHMPDEVSIESILCTMLKAFADEPTTFQTEIQIEQGYVIGNSFGGGVLACLFTAAVYEQEKNRQNELRR
jgi:predicted regulator of Ras-like GTPase activity (Roadblock/LC7/MglB family)